MPSRDQGTPRRERPAAQTPRRGRPGGQTPREHAEHAAGAPGAARGNTNMERSFSFTAADFPEVHEALEMVPRGRKARRSRVLNADGEEVLERARSLSRPADRGLDSDAAEVAEPCGRARAYSADRGMDALEESAAREKGNAPVKGCLKKRASVEGSGNRPEANNEELDAAEDELKATLERMANLLRKSQKGDAMDAESQVAVRISHLLANMGNPEDGAGGRAKASTSFAPSADEEGCDRAKGSGEADGAAVHHEANSISTSSPPGAASWDYPMSCNEKKARVIQLSSQEIAIQQEEIAALKDMRRAGN